MGLSQPAALMGQSQRCVLYNRIIIEQISVVHVSFFQLDSLTDIMRLLEMLCVLYIPLPPQKHHKKNQHVDKSSSYLLTIIAVNNFRVHSWIFFFLCEK